MSVESYSIFGSSFEEQFARREEIKTAGGIAEVIDVAPEHPKSEIPVFLAESWSMSIDVYGPLIKMLAENRRIVSLDHPRIGGDMPEIEEKLAQYPKNELRKAFTIVDVLNAKGIEKTDALAHSESAINVSLAALLHPEKFRNIIFYAPAGMIGPDTFSRLIEGFGRQSEKSATLQEMNLPEPEQDVLNKVKKAFLRYVAKNPIRAVGEVADIAQSQIHDIIRYLHDKGIGVVIMSAVDDPVFPAEKMQEIAKQDMIDGYLSLRGGHAISTEGPLFAKGIEEMFSALEKKSERN